MNPGSLAPESRLFNQLKRPPVNSLKLIHHQPRALHRYYFFNHSSIPVSSYYYHFPSQFSQMRKLRLRKSQGHSIPQETQPPHFAVLPPQTSYTPHPSQFLCSHAGLWAHLESGSWQVGDGNILEVILQGIDERGHCKLECVHVLHQDSLVEEKNQVLHVT